MCARWALVSNGAMGACWPEMETCVSPRWVLVSNGAMGACWVGAGKQWRHGCVLDRCWSGMEMEYVCVGWMLIGNEDMCLCLTTMEAAKDIPLHG